MLTLYRSPAYEGLLGGASPFVYKLETWLRMANLPFQTVNKQPVALMEEAPRGLVPYVDLDGERLDDSSIIIDRLKQLHNDPLDDARLSQSQHVQGRLIKSLCEHDLYDILAYARWIDGDYETYGEFFLQEVPARERKAETDKFHRFLKERLHVWKLGRYDSDFVYESLRAHLGDISYLLGDGPFLFDDEPSTYDTTVFGIVASILHFPLPNPDVKIANEYSNLVAYCDRIRAKYYDYESGDV